VSPCAGFPFVVHAHPRAGVPTATKCTGSWRWSQKQVVSKPSQSFFCY
jgi:hypothetical protein